MDGKEKCKALKQIRKQIAENNDIKYVVDECKHKGKCKGTCPKCEAEVRYLENELAKKRALGQKVAIAGVSLGIAASFSACTPTDVVNSLTYPIRDVFNIDISIKGPEPEIAGDMSEPIYDLQGEVAPEEELGGDEADYHYDNDGNEDDDCADPDSDTKEENTQLQQADPDDYELEGDIEYNEEFDF